ncbi:hypothetical protein CJF30_00009043 [Rutstroemia sp. NJR-2017a BBW]|nr:hypothetical protein CJF30_00009043 [Rutstroemia sp. NJR-2017a BBW]
MIYYQYLHEFYDELPRKSYPDLYRLQIFTFPDISLLILSSRSSENSVIQSRKNNISTILISVLKQILRAVVIDELRSICGGINTSKKRSVAQLSIQSTATSITHASVVLLNMMKGRTYSRARVKKA